MAEADVMVLVIGNRWRVRLDKWTYTIGIAAVAAAIVLGALAGALPGVLTALAGLVSAVLWQAAADRQRQARSRGTVLADAERNLALPGPVPPGPGPSDEQPGGGRKHWPRSRRPSPATGS